MSIHLQQVNTKDRMFEQLQGNIQRALDELAPFQAVQLERVELTAGETKSVPHSLGKKLRGYIVVRKRGTADVWDEQDENPNPTRTLWLRTSVNVVVDLLVYG